MQAMKRLAASRRELPVARQIPYTTHAAVGLVKTQGGDYVQVYRLAGASFESADDEDLNNWHERLNVTWRNIASPNVALWTHVLRRREHTGPKAANTGGFSARLTRKYSERLAGETLMVNELYLSVVYRPVTGVATGVISRLLPRTAADGGSADFCGCRGSM